ncbi:hypothetical protein EP331_10225 [bacterium]|nr:MAG: hypothetical protein EP331_10225 [bacterium]
MILFDIYHTPQLNFFKESIKKQSPSNVIVSIVDRGKLKSIAHKELDGYSIISLGSYRYNYNFVAMLLLIILPRFFQLAYLVWKYKIKFVVTANYQANLVAKLFGVPNIVFNDDPRKGVIEIAEFSANEAFVTKGIKRKKSIELNVLKEWAYLSPDYFIPNIGVLKEYGLLPFSYYFIREVSTNTSNYYDQENLTSLQLEIEGTVLLSLEDKSKLNRVNSEWKVLKEPISDIHSLMYFSKAFLSTGDSMAREAAELGVPAYYLGIRDMYANNELIQMGYLKKIEIKNVNRELSELPVLSTIEDEIKKRNEKRMYLSEQWEDINRLIDHKIKYYHK